MAGLYGWNTQDTSKRKEHDGNASEMMKEGDIRRRERFIIRLVLFFFSNFHTREGVSLPCLFTRVLFVPYYVSLVLHSPVALSTEFLFYAIDALSIFCLCSVEGISHL